MNIDVNKTKKIVTFAIQGRIDTTTAPALDKMVDAHIDGVEEFVLDLKEVTYISSAGLRVLLSTQKKMNKVGVLTVRNVCDEVMEILEMTGFADILNIQ